jgi:hypothetical protein
MKKPNAEQQASEQEPSERPHRAARKPAAAEYYIYFLPEGKQGPRVKKGSLPLDVEFEEHIDERTDLEPGLYRIERRKGGEFPKDICHYTKEDYLSDEPTPDGRAESAVLSDDGDDSEVEQGPAGNSLDAASIAKLVAASVNAAMDARDRRERAAAGQPDPLDQFRQMRELLKEERREMRDEMRAMTPKENPAPREPELSDRQRLELAVIKETGAIKAIFQDLKAAIGTAEQVDKPEGLTDKIFGLLREAVPFVAPYVAPVIGPAVGEALSNALNRQGLAQQASGPQQASSAPTSQPPVADVRSAPSMPPQQSPPPITTQMQAPGADAEGPMTLELFVLNLKTDLQENNDPDDAVTDAVKLITEQPQLLPTLEGLMIKPNDEVLALLSQATGTQLGQLANAHDYLDGLREGLRERMKPRVQPPVVATANGNHAQAKSV